MASFNYGVESLSTLFVKATLGEYIDGDGTLWQMAYQLMPLASSNGTELLGSIWVLVGFFFNLVESGRVWSGLVGSGRVWSGLVGSGRVWLGLVGSGRVWSGLVGSGRVWSDLLGSGRV